MISYHSASANLDTNCQQSLTICNGNGKWSNTQSDKRSISCNFLQNFSQNYIQTHQAQVIDPQSKNMNPTLLSVSSKQGESCTTPRSLKIPHGASTVSYDTAQASFDEVCNAKISFCDNGGWLNNITPYQNQKCTLTTPNNCDLKAMLIPHDTDIEVYNSTCEKQTRYCFDGLLDGDE